MIKGRLLRKKIYKGKQEKKINTVISFSFLLFFVLAISGCQKKVLTANEFTSKMENKNYVVADISNDSKTEILAVGNHYQVYFYQYKNMKIAKKELNKDIKTIKSENNKIEKKQTDTIITYKIYNKNVYTVYSLRDNTYIFVNSTKSYLGEVNDMLSYLGY